MKVRKLKKARNLNSTQFLICNPGHNDDGWLRRHQPDEHGRGGLHVLSHVDLPDLLLGLPRYSHELRVHDLRGGAGAPHADDRAVEVYVCSNSDLERICLFCFSNFFHISFIMQI